MLIIEHTQKKCFASPKLGRCKYAAVYDAVAISPQECLRFTSKLYLEPWNKHVLLENNYATGRDDQLWLQLWQCFWQQHQQLPCLQLHQEDNRKEEEKKETPWFSSSYLDQHHSVSVLRSLRLLAVPQGKEKLWYRMWPLTDVSFLLGESLLSR